jgi:hypothetical protein
MKYILTMPGKEDRVIEVNYDVAIKRVKEMGGDLKIYKEGEKA